MPRKSNSIQYELMKNFDFSRNNNTLKSQKNTIKAFAKFCKEHQLSIDDIRADPHAALQKYSDYLQKETKYTAGTIHTKLAAACKSLSVNMSEISKPKRTQATLQRGRGISVRSVEEMSKPEFARSVMLQEAIGIRRAELRRIKPEDLCNFAGYLCVFVRSGKGGKDTFQRVRPGYEDTVRKIFAESKGNTVLQANELKNHIDYHSIRAKNVQQDYEFYRQKCSTYEGQKEVILALKGYYAKLHRNPDGFQKWINKTLHHDAGKYHLRGENKERAIEKGMPVVYDRLPLLALSVFHLSHWRLDVTVTNYLLH